MTWGEGRRPAPSAGHGLATCGQRVAKEGHPGLARSRDCAAQWPAGLRLQGRDYFTV